MEKNLVKARGKQKKHYDKTRRDVLYEEQDRVWMRSHPYSKAEKAFSAKLAPKWQGPYRIVRRLSPLNYEIVLEESGEVYRVAHVSRLKPCYPTAKEVEERQRRQVIEILLEDSEDEEFLGFSPTQVENTVKRYDVKCSLQSTPPDSKTPNDSLAQKKQLLRIFEESSDDDEFLGFQSDDLN